jgi:small subunit ribosomal protein S3
VHPNGFRLGVIRGWESRWYANRTYKDLVGEDAKLRAAIRKRLYNAGVSRIEIERVAGTQISIAIHTAKPGIVIGKSGESVERLRQQLEEQTKKKVRLSILEIRNPEVEAYLIGRSIAEQIEKRVSFRRAMKQAVQKAMRQGAKGIKVIIGGRLGGAEIARTEKEVEGSVPLQTLRANIDYGQTEAHTTYGVIGIKVWVYHGDVLPERQRAEGFQAAQPVAPPMPAGGERGERPRGGERGGRGGERGAGPGGGRGGERGTGFGGERGAPRSTRAADRAPRPTGGGPSAGGGMRGPRPGAATGTAPRPGPATGGGPRSAPHPERAAPTERPASATAPETAPELPSSGPVTPAPAAHEFPAPASNEGPASPVSNEGATGADTAPAPQPGPAPDTEE